MRYATSVGQGEVVIRFEQEGPQVFDVPVTVTITYNDGRVTDVIVPLAAAREEHRVPTTGTVRNVQLNKDFAALAEFSGR